MTPTLQQAPRRPTPPPETHRQVWVRLLWGRCSFLLGPGAHRVLFVPSKSLFPQSCEHTVSSTVGLMVTFFKRSHACTAALSAPSPAAGHRRPTPPPDSWTPTGKSGPVSCGVTLSFSSVLVHTRFSLCLPRVYFPVLCKFWQLYGGVNGNLLQ